MRFKTTLRGGELKMRMPVVITEGLIGSGKSTLTNELGKALGENCLVLMEPTSEEEGAEVNPYLASYYADNRRWSLTMQVHLLALRYRMHLHAQWHAMQGYGPAVIDRSFYGDTAFARLQLKMGIMEEREFNTYAAIYHGMTASVLLPTVCVRVLVDPETCNERIARRMEKLSGRRCEAAIDLNYLKGLDIEIDHMISVLRNQGVCIIDMPWDVNRDSVEARSLSIKSLASRILSMEPMDWFLDLHRRSL
jgi:deoxyadenosine/deoxycytidine kinase